MRLLIFGLGFCGTAAARDAVAAGWDVSATSRNPGTLGPPGVCIVPFRAAGAAIAACTHILATAPPREDADPVLSRYDAEIRSARNLAWIGYLSTTGRLRRPERRLGRRNH